MVGIFPGAPHHDYVPHLFKCKQGQNKGVTSTNKPFDIYVETKSAWYKLPWGQGFEKWIVKIFVTFIKLLQNKK